MKKPNQMQKRLDTTSKNEPCIYLASIFFDYNNFYFWNNIVHKFEIKNVRNPRQFRKVIRLVKL